MHRFTRLDNLLFHLGVNGCRFTTCAPQLATQPLSRSFMRIRAWQLSFIVAVQ